MTDNVADLGRKARDLADAFDRHHAQLMSRPVTHAEMLLGAVNASCFDWDAADACLRAMDAALKRNPQATFSGWGTPDNSLRGERERLAGELDALKAYRGK